MIGNRTILGSLGIGFFVLAGQTAVVAQCDPAQLYWTDTGTGDTMGRSADADGEWAVVGAPLYDIGCSDNNCNQGAVFIFQHHDGGTPNDPSDDGWLQFQRIYANDRANGDQFGYSVAIAGSYIVVGAPYDDDGGTSSGSSYVFRFNGTSWQFEGKHSAWSTTGDNFGFSVGIAIDSSGSDAPHIVVGAPGYDTTSLACTNGVCSNVGAAFVFTRTILGWWAQPPTPSTGNRLLASDRSPGDEFGYSVDINLEGSVNRVIVGAPFDDDDGTSSGSAYVFNFLSSNTWGQAVKLPGSSGPGEGGGQFGRSVEIGNTSSLDQLFYVGEPYANRSAGQFIIIDAGAVHVYDYIERGGYWNLDHTFYGGGGSLFGLSIDVAGENVLVGAPNAYSNTGAAYLFHGPQASWGTAADAVLRDVTAPSDSGDYLGYAVGLTDEVMLAGAYLEDSFGTNAGLAYIQAYGDDVDDDGVIDACDNCPNDANADQANGDADSLGNVCDNCPSHDNENQADGDNDGYGDVCDNCPSIANGADLSTCVAGLITPCTTDDECDTTTGSMDGRCSAALGFCVVGLATTCTSNADCDDVGGDGVCGADQADQDSPSGDLVGDLCDNCPNESNANQADYNDNGLGDVCDPAWRVGDELVPPSTPEYANVDPAMYSAANVTPATAAFYYDKVYCLNGTPQNCAAWEGRWFVNEPSDSNNPLTITWKDSNGSSVGDPVVYIASDAVGEAPPGSTYDVAGVQYFLDWDDPSQGKSAPVSIDTAYDLTIRYNATYLVNDPQGGSPEDVRLLGGLVTVDNRVPGKIVFQYTDGPGGPLVGLEVVNIGNFGSPTATPVEVGRQLDIPAGGDCKAVFIENVEENGFAAAWQRSEQTTDIWPIRPEPVAAKFVVAWYASSSPLLAPNCWHHSIGRYTSDWPVDPQKHIIVDDGQPDQAVVFLPVGPTETYCSAQVVYPSAFVPPYARLTGSGGNEFTADVPGYSVIRLDVRPNCAGPRTGVNFEVIRSYNHLDFWDSVADTGVYEGVMQAPIGTQLSHPEHDTNTPVYTYGRLYVDPNSQPSPPFNEMVYADTGQIFPVNSSNVHGLLEVWWYKESPYAPNTYWPHRSARYDVDWPISGSVSSDTQAANQKIIIASRSGAGSYPPGAQIYDQGLYQGPTDINGWNPNDEHAILLPIAGSLRAFAVRDDNPWGVTSGHPYVLVEYPQYECSVGGNPCISEADCGSGETCDPNGLWGMGVHEVVGEEPPYDFDYTDFPNQSNPSETLPVVAGLPIDPLFPVNLGAAQCLTGTPAQPQTAVVGDALWVDRKGGIWSVEETDDITGLPSSSTVYLWENWAPDGGCQPWRGFYPNGTGPGTTPYPIVFRPSWPQYPPACSPQIDATCAPLYHPGQKIDESGQCGPIERLHDSVGVRVIDPTLEVELNYPNLPAEVDFEKLPPHLIGGQMGGGGEWPDRIRYAQQTLYFRGVMSDRDKELLDTLSLDSSYQSAIDTLQTLSRDQLINPLPNPNQKFVSLADANVQPGWVTLAFQNDQACNALPISVEVWRVECPPDRGRIQVIEPTCPFNEKLVLQHSIDGGGTPKNLIYQWQWSVDYDPNDPQLATWNDYNPPSGYGDGQGLREVIIEGASPFTLADSWWRSRYRGYGNCPCNGNDCNENGDPWPQHLASHPSELSNWTDPQLAEGWVKRVVRGINPFDQRVADFHDNAASTYVDMISQAGNRYEQPVALNCTPDNINNLGLIEVYETVSRRARQFSIDVGLSYDPATLAILLVTSKVADLYMLLGNEAFADASDPTIGLFAGAGQPSPSYDPHAMFCFKDQLPTILDEELALLRGRDQIRPPDTDIDGRILATVYNRLPWNFTSGDGQVAYANNYQVTNVVEARETYPQGQGDAWGHYVTATKKFYNLLKHPVFEWIVSTESVLVGGQPVQVGFQYERAFAEAAAAKARAGAAVTSLTFRQLFDADPTKQNGYPDPSDPNRAWGVNQWARRSGQAAYFDWAVANTLLDDEDDDPSHQNSIRKIDRTTVPELREIASAFSEIQSTMDKADAGLNPLGLAANVVPFGLNPAEIEAGKTHFEQIYERALVALSNAVTAFDYANDNTRRLRSQQDEVSDFQNLVEERERDFNSRLIELFGRPYPEDVGPGGAYSQSTCPGGDCPDIYHFDYVEPSRLIGQSSSGTKTVTVPIKELQVNPTTGNVSDATVQVPFTISTDGIGFVKPQSWTTRPELGEIQFARTEVIQAIGRLEQGLEDYEAHLDQIEFQRDVLESVYELGDQTLQILNSNLGTLTSLQLELRTARSEENAFRQSAAGAEGMARAAAEALPKVLGFSNDMSGPVRALALMGGTLASTTFTMLADNAAYIQLIKQHDIAEMQAQQQIDITGWEFKHQATQQIAVLRQLVRELPSYKLQLYQLGEAINQATGRYHSAIGRAYRLLEQRTAFRQHTADQVSQYRYRDMAFRVFRNDALQKYRAQYDLAAMYAYLATRAYDYETNQLGTNQGSGQEFLTNIVKERVLGVVNGGLPMVGNGLAGQLAMLANNWLVAKPQLGFNSATELNRTFSLRWEMFRIPNSISYDAEWSNVLANSVISDLNALQEYHQYCQPLQPPVPNNPAIVIPLTTTIQSTLNFFGWPSTGDATLPSDRFAIKMHSYAVRFSHYPGAPLNQQANVYLVPVGADIMRAPSCPDAPIREWHLLDQTLPAPFAITAQDLQTPGWVPTDALDGGTAAMIRRRLIPTVAACAAGDVNCTDISYKLTGRSLWNTRWLLIIPGSELQGSDPANGINVFVNGPSAFSTGVRDIKLELKSYGYSGCLGGKSLQEENPDGMEEDGAADAQNEIIGRQSSAKSPR